MPPPPTPEHDTPTASSARPLPPFASLGDRLPTIMASYLFGSASTSNRQPQQPRAMASNISASTTSETGHAQAGTPYTAMPPTIVMPQEWSVPAYLKHSVFYDRFTVSPSSVPPLQSTSTLSGTSASSGGETLGSITGTLEGGRWGSLVAASSTSFIDPRATTASGNPAVRLPSQALSAQERYQECLDTPHAKIPLPSKLDPKHCCKRLLIQDGVVQFCPEKDDQGRDKLNRHDPEKDAAAVRADYPIPPQAGIYYFEVDIVSKGQKGYIGIGFSSRAVDLERLPGWNPESYGYHGDDGKAFACSGTGQTYSEKFGSGDTIGCGIDFVAKRAFFVKNGKWLGYIFDLSSQIGERDDPTLKPNYGIGSGASRRDRERGKLKETPGTAPLQFYPTVGLQTPGETVRVNFGQEPFNFDIESFVKRRRRETTATVLEQRIPLSFKQTLAPSFPPLPTSSSSKPDTSQQPNNDGDDPHVQACMQNLIASYLNYRGYSETARSFRKQREAERHLWRDVVSESAASYASIVAAASASDAPTNGVSGSSTPAKKKGKRKSEGGSKKLLKSALRTTLAGSEQASEVPMDTEDSQTRIEPVMDDDDEMQSTSELDKSTSRATPTGVRDDLMTTDVKKSSTGMDDLEADEAELEDTLHRQNVCSALRRGDVDLAMREIEDHYPGVILPSARDSLRAMLNGKQNQDSDEASKLRRTELLFKLRCRKFVELVLASSANDGNKEDDADMEAEVEEDEDEQIASQLISSNGSSPQVVTAENHALSSNKGKGKAAGSSEAGNSTPQVSFDQVLSYGSQLNSLYPANDPNTPPHVLSQLKLLFSLVAYANPADLSSHGNKAIYELTRQEERDRLAEEVNKAMLESKGQPGIPHLELIYKQAHTVRNVLGGVFGDGRAALLGDVVDT